MVLEERGNNTVLPVLAAWEERISRRNVDGQCCSSFSCITIEVSKGQDCRKLGIVAQRKGTLWWQYPKGHWGRAGAC